MSKNTISQVEFNIEISGNQKNKDFKGRIVGFSNKVNSILVPEDFLLWANTEFARQNNTKTSRILIEFNNPSDKNILKYFNENNYSINREKLEFSKMVFFFKTVVMFVFFIAVVIIALSVSFILLSFNLIIQRNKELLFNLYNIGYNHTQIARFYQLLISITTVFSILMSVIVSYWIRNFYLAKITNLFDFTMETNYILTLGILLVVLFSLIYNALIIKNIKKTVVPRKEK